MKNLIIVASALVLISGSAFAAKPGDKVYSEACAACHGSGVGGAPKLGDKAAWKDRIAKGNAALYESALKGVQGKDAKGNATFMPAKGGRADMSDDEVKAAVDHMVSKAK